MKKTKQITPFSNGSEAESWYHANCGQCTRAYFPKDGRDYPKEESMKVYCSIGKECRLKYYIDWGFVTGEIPLHIAEKIGFENERIAPKCQMFTDEKRLQYQPKKKSKKYKNQLTFNFEP